MSSLGGQWRVLRHYLSLNNLHAEFDKLVQRIRPSSPEQWDNLMKRFQGAVTGSVTRDVHVVKAQSVDATKAATVDETEVKPNVAVEEPAEVKVKEPSPAPPAPTAASDTAVPTELKDISFKGLLQGLILKKDTHLGKISEPTWKTNKPTVSKTSIHSRTAYVVGAVSEARSAESSLRRAERLVEHLHEYPEARDYAIKEGAVRALLRVQNRLNLEDPLDKEIDGVVKEALALVGWGGLPRGAGANVLSLDGGGVRGLIAIELLRHVERLTGRPARELFDYIVGVSTGAIIAAHICSARGTLDDAGHMYRTLSRDMFGATTRLGGGARLVWSQAYYDTDAWERMLQDNLQDLTLTNCNRFDTPKLALVSCVVSGARLSPFLFRSYSVGFRVRSVFPGTARARLWQAVRASAAAPTYFHEFRLDGHLHQDGGIMVNNPSAVGLHEARLLFGERAVRQGTLLSLGTGRAPAPASDSSTHSDTNTSWRDKFHKILDSATDTEGVHLVLNDLLPAGHYYRFNPPLMRECAMDEVDPRRLDALVQDTQAYIRRNQHKLSAAAAMLVRRRSLAQRVADAAQRAALLAGAKQHY